MACKQTTHMKINKMIDPIFFFHTYYVQTIHGISSISFLNTFKYDKVCLHHVVALFEYLRNLQQIKYVVHDVSTVGIRIARRAVYLSLQIFKIDLKTHLQFA